VDSTQLTADQATDLADRIGRMAGYLKRLADRMQQRGWVGGDPLYEDMKAAENAMHRLHVTLRELARLHRAASSERPEWSKRMGGSGRTPGS
jgi:hypothetical protein